MAKYLIKNEKHSQHLYLLYTQIVVGVSGKLDQTIIKKMHKNMVY